MFTALRSADVSRLRAFGTHVPALMAARFSRAEAACLARYSAAFLSRHRLDFSTLAARLCSGVNFDRTPTKPGVRPSLRALAARAAFILARVRSLHFLSFAAFLAALNSGVTVGGRPTRLGSRPSAIALAALFSFRASFARFLCSGVRSASGTLYFSRCSGVQVIVEL